MMQICKINGVATLKNIFITRISLSATEYYDSYNKCANNI